MSTVRNRKNRKDIANDIIAQITALDSLELDAITAIINKEMATGGSSNSRQPKEIDGVMNYYCSRSNTFNPIEDMVTNTDGSSRGYSRESQEILTETNRAIKAIKADVMDAVTAQDFAVASKLSDELTELEAKKASNEIYR